MATSSGTKKVQSGQEYKSPLNATQMRSLKSPPEDQKLPDKYSDAGGLQLHSYANGRMTWILAYRFNGRQKGYTIGSYPDVTLAQAREIQADKKKLIRQGVDPMEAKKLKKQDDAGHNSFQYVALQWFAKKEPTWSVSNANKVKRRLEVDVFPYIGRKNISEVLAPDLLRVIERVEARSVDTAHRALGECSQIFRYGMAIGTNIHDPSIPIQDALTPNTKKHFAAIIEPKAVGELLRAIDGFNGSFVVKCALQLAPLFFVRIGELRKAKWSEIDFGTCEWRFFITKTKQDHIVSLSSQAIAILRDLQQLTGTYEHVFIGGRDPKRPMSDAAINAALQRMGYDTKNVMTGHGFRAMARTLLHERLGMDRDVIEHQLAHSVGDALGTAYNRTKFLDQRKAMMQTWSDYLDELRCAHTMPFLKATI